MKQTNQYWISSIINYCGARPWAIRRWAYERYAGILRWSNGELRTYNSLKEISSRWKYKNKPPFANISKSKRWL